ncbi:Rmf/CrpP family protein [Lentzea sp. JNUCC 0626]|uniref:Rmf/CrpP family protein n=1 Tax=Lentzea sp. JNUCC 0626 TaxID=3367513 RepID=UPI00374A8F25
MNPNPNAADVLGPKDILAAQEKGRASALAGECADNCPWKAPETNREHALQDMWIRGYSQGRTELRHATGAP